MSTLRIVAAVSALLLAAGPASAASDYLLQLDPVKGESKDAAAPQTIEVQSFSWGVSNPSSSVKGSGAGAGKVNVQDLSVMSVKSPRDAASGQASGKRTASVAPTDGSTDAAVAAPQVGDVASFTVLVRESPTKSSTGKSGGCVAGTHFPHAVVVAQGKRYEFADVVLTSCTDSDGLRKKEYTGHVTLMK